MDVHTSTAGNSTWLADTVVSVNTTYGIGLTPTVKNPGSTSSDHSPFWTKGFAAVMLIEDMTSNFNQNYHTANDNLNNLNGPYFHKMTKLAIGTLAVLAGIRTTSTTQPEQRIPVASRFTRTFPTPSIRRPRFPMT